MLQLLIAVCSAVADDLNDCVEAWDAAVLGLNLDHNLVVLAPSKKSPEVQLAQPDLQPGKLKYTNLKKLLSRCVFGIQRGNMIKVSSTMYMLCSQSMHVQ